MKLSDACDAYLRDMEARHLRPSTLKNYKYLFRAWVTYAKERELSNLDSFDQTEMRTWRESWACKPSTQTRQLQQLKAFFRHALQLGWITQSPMTGMKPPRSRSKPTMPLSRDDFRALVAASATRPKEQALLFLMRFSGLSICDAVILRRDAIKGNNLTLRRAKSGELVMLYVPDLVIAALHKIKRPGHVFFFWTGSSRPSSAANYWRTRLNLIARKAGVNDFRTHRLRDTFAVEALLAGISMKNLSTLLGHSSVITTERYYAPWDVSRRDQLVRITREMYECNPSLLVFDGFIPKKNNTGAVTAAPVNNSASSPMQSSSIK